MHGNFYKFEILHFLPNSRLPTVHDYKGFLEHKLCNIVVMLIKKSWGTYAYYINTHIHFFEKITVLCMLIKYYFSLQFTT